MKLHFPISATITAPRWLVDTEAGWASTIFPIRYGVIERHDGLVLIDTGYSRALFESRERALYPYRWLLRPKLDPAGDAVAVVKALGASTSDVRDIILTHLHADHICGIDRFPKAMLHMSRASFALWSSLPGWRDHKAGFFRSLMPPLGRSKVCIIDDASSAVLPWGGEGHDVLGDGSVISVDLPGHMMGHVGLFFPNREKPLLYAVDADWTSAPILSGRRPNWPVGMIVGDAEAAASSAETVRAAAAWGAGILLCHDPEPWP